MQFLSRGRVKTQYKQLPPPRAWEMAEQPRQQLVVSDNLQKAYKSTSYSQYVEDFINDNDTGVSNYSERQVEAAYQTSVFLFSALRRVANLMSEIVVAAEVKKDGEWVRLPNTHKLNMLLDECGAQFFYRMYINYAMYGSALTYKEKTLKAKYAETRGEALTKFGEGGIAGLHLIPNAHWTMREDTYLSEILGFDLHTPDEVIGDQQLLRRDECIYVNDFNPRYVNDGISMVFLALNNAVTNAAIARWASHYFMSGAMPLLLVNIDEEDALLTKVDARRYKNLVERAWQGLWSKFSARALFTDRKLNVQEAGITADKVQAPELNRDSLNQIASVFQIAPDLIVPPEGGSDNARHKYLVQQAYTDAVIPVAKHFLSAITNDLGLKDDNLRLVVAEDKMRALQADRGERSTTELSIYQGGVQPLGVTQAALNIDIVEQLKDFVNINGRVQSVERVLRDDALPPADYLQHFVSAWENGGIVRSEYRIAMGLPPQVKGEKDGFKHEVVPEAGGGGSPYGGAPQFPSSQEPPQLPPSSDGDDTPPPDGPPSSDGEEGEKPGTPLLESGDKQGDGNTTPVPTSEEEDKPATPKDKEPPSGVEPEVKSDDDLISTMQPEDKAAYVYLHLGEDSLIRTMRDALARQLGGVDGIHWEDPGNWHVTLVYASACSDAALESIYNLIPKTLDYIPLSTSGLICFDTPNGLCVALAVDLNDQLLHLQNSVAVAFHAHTVPISKYSITENYTPHITLAYLPKDTPPPTMSGAIVAVPRGMAISREEYEKIYYSHYEREGLPAYPGAIRTPGKRIIERNRQRLRALIRLWNTNGGDAPPGLTPRLSIWIAEAKGAGTSGNLLDAAMDAVNDGYCDSGAEDPEQNPLIVYMNKQEKRAIQATPKAELKAWERGAIRNGVKRAQRFEVALLPSEIETSIRAALPQAKSREDIQAIFSAGQERLSEIGAVTDTRMESMLAWGERITETGDEGLLALLEDDDEVGELS